MHNKERMSENRSQTGQKVISIHQYQRQVIRERIDGQVDQSQPDRVKKSGSSIFFSLVCTTLIALAVLPLKQSVESMEKAKAELIETETKFQNIKERAHLVQSEYQKSKDPEYMAKIARRDYYYSEDGEVIFDVGDAFNEIDHQIFKDVVESKEQ